MVACFIAALLGAQLLQEVCIDRAIRQWVSHNLTKMQ